MGVVFLDADQFKLHFDRGQFTYGDTPPAIRDKDIVAAIGEMEAIINAGLYPGEDTQTLAKLYLTAHFLTLDIQASKTGGQPTFSFSPRAVGSISASMDIPDWMKKGLFAQYATTYYGQKWLALTKPYTIGVVRTIAGTTQP